MVVGDNVDIVGGKFVGDTVGNVGIAVVAFWHVMLNLYVPDSLCEIPLF